MDIGIRILSSPKYLVKEYKILQIVGGHEGPYISILLDFGCDGAFFCFFLCDGAF